MIEIAAWIVSLLCVAYTSYRLGRVVEHNATEKAFIAEQVDKAVASKKAKPVPNAIREFGEAVKNLGRVINGENDP